MRVDAYRWFVRGTALALGAALGAGVVFLLLYAAGAVLLVFFAILFASALDPLIDLIRGRAPVARGAALLLVYAVFFVAVAALVLLVVPGAINQFNDLGSRATPVLDDARSWAATIEPRALSTGLVGLIDSIQRTISPRATDVPQPDELIALGLTFAEILVSISSLLALVYFWLTERARLQRFALALVPSERRAGAREAWNEIELRLGAWARGQLIVMGSIGIATTIAYFLIGLEGPLLLGLIAALAEAIPIIGPALGAVPALGVAALTGRIELVILVAVVYIVIQVIEGNVLVPVVMHNAIGVPPFLVFVSILVGAAVAGIPGALISVPLVAAGLVVVERLQVRDSPVPLAPQSSAPKSDDLVAEVASAPG